MVLITMYFWRFNVSHFGEIIIDQMAWNVIFDFFDLMKWYGYEVGLTKYWMIIDTSVWCLLEIIRQ